MEATEVDAKPISKDTESPESDQPPSKESGSLKATGQNKCGYDGPSTVKSRSSREDKLRKKDDKSVEHVLKALNSLNTTEEKLAAMCKKYADIFDENRKLQLAMKQSEKRSGVLQREKEQLQAEQSKSVLTRCRLENLCRELQRQNKAIKDESLSKIREEEEKRKEVSAKFQSTLSEINHLMQQNTDKNSKLRDDNLDMNARLKSVCEQYELREKEVDRISKQMQLESQLAEAKLAKAKMEMAAEKEMFIREKQQLLVEITQYQARCQEFQTNEIKLRKQISLYNEKYDEFQRALAKSNEVFGGFKVEMDKMSKKILKLEKETITWKQRWENSHQALLSMADDKQKTDQELGLVNRQLSALQGLCRTLQTERTAMLAKLKDAGIKNDEQTPVLTNGDVSTDIATNKEQEPPTIVSCDKKHVSSKSATSSSAVKKLPDSQQNPNAKCLNANAKNSAKRCEKEKSNSIVEGKKSDVTDGSSPVDSGLEAKVNGQFEASNTSADGKVEVLPGNNDSVSTADGKVEVLPGNNVSVSAADSQVQQNTDNASKVSVVCSVRVDKALEPGSSVEKDNVTVKKETPLVPAESEQVPVESKQVAADSTEVRAVSTPVAVDSKQVSAASTPVSVDSKQVSAVSTPVSVDFKQVNAVSPPVSADFKQVACDSEKVPADSKQVTAKSKANVCKKTASVTSPAKGDTVGAKESTATSPKASESKPDVPSTPEANKQERCHSPTAAGDKTATSPKAATCEAKKAKESKKRKK